MARILEFWVVLWKEVAESLNWLSILIQRFLRQIWIRILIGYHSLMNFIKVLHKIVWRSCLQNGLIKKHQLSFNIRYALQRDLWWEKHGIYSLIERKLSSCISNNMYWWKVAAGIFGDRLLALRYQRTCTLGLLLDLFSGSHWGIFFHD